jgi:hypothetical protein
MCKTNLLPKHKSQKLIKKRAKASAATSPLFAPPFENAQSARQNKTLFKISKIRKKHFLVRSYLKRKTI